MVRSVWLLRLHNGPEKFMLTLHCCCSGAQLHCCRFDSLMHSFAMIDLCIMHTPCFYTLTWGKKCAYTQSFTVFYNVYAAQCVPTKWRQKQWTQILHDCHTYFSHSFIKNLSDEPLEMNTSLHHRSAVNSNFDKTSNITMWKCRPASGLLRS